ncbi:MAG: PRC-barrel domain containing protein [Desulfobacteraceae bacterium]|nr:MAG: PRC-barrel domain containing protein [Desulfobacteraceae bacterium]
MKEVPVMYAIMKQTSKLLAIFSVVALVLGASVNADARDTTMDRTMAPAGVAVNELLGMEVRTNAGEEIASIDDVILANGRVMEVVLDYEGELVSVPIQDLRFTADNHVVYEGTRGHLDAAVDRYVYGKGPFVYAKADSVHSRGYYDTDARYGRDFRFRQDSFHDGDLVFSGPDTHDMAYGDTGYGAELRYGSNIRQEGDVASYDEDRGYISDSDRTYYERREYTSDAPRQYYGADVRYGSGFRSDSIAGEPVYSGPDPSGLDYADRGYNAELRYGSRLPNERDTSIHNDMGDTTQRGYYEEDARVHSGPDRGDVDYGFDGYGAELRFGPKY